MKAMKILFFVIIIFCNVETQARINANPKIVSVKKINTKGVYGNKLIQFSITGYQKKEFWGRMKLKLVCIAQKKLYYGEISTEIRRLWKDGTYTQWKVNVNRSLGKRINLRVKSYVVEYMIDLGGVLAFKGKRNLNKPSNSEIIKLSTFGIASNKINNFDDIPIDK